jgi:hypothetical protein
MNKMLYVKVMLDIMEGKARGATTVSTNQILKHLMLLKINLKTLKLIKK